MGNLSLSGNQLYACSNRCVSKTFQDCIEGGSSTIFSGDFEKDCGDCNSKYFTAEFYFGWKYYYSECD